MSNSLKITILIIEDEQNIASFICKTLKMHQYKTLQAFTGAEGLSMASSQCPDLILLDLGLPDMDGLKIIEDIRKWSSIPIIVVSARTQEKEKVAALDAGADDYITKPFGTAELLARIRTSIRHSYRLNNRSQITVRPSQAGNLIIELEKRIVTCNNEQVH